MFFNLDGPRSDGGLQGQDGSWRKIREEGGQRSPGVDTSERNVHFFVDDEPLVVKVVRSILRAGAGFVT